MVGGPTEITLGFVGVLKNPASAKFVSAYQMKTWQVFVVFNYTNEQLELAGPCTFAISAKAALALIRRRYRRNSLRSSAPILDTVAKLAWTTSR